MTTTAVRTLEESVEIEAPPAAVWSVVSDVRRTGEWSPECRRVVVLGRGPVAEGSRILGINRRGLMVWPTTSRVHRFEPGQAIGWTVAENGAQWTYELQPTASGTLLTERREAPHGIAPLAARFTDLFLGGNEPHSGELEEGMRQTLGRIKQIVERVA